MRRLAVSFALAAVAVLAGGTPSQARDYPWCAYYDWSTYNCGFVSFEQCLATVRGIGGYCARNPWYAAAPEPAPYRKRKIRR